MTHHTTQQADDPADNSIGPVRLSAGPRRGLRTAALAGLTFAAILAADGETDPAPGDTTCWTPGMTRGQCVAMADVQVADL